jgi:hypothetical protein
MTEQDQLAWQNGLAPEAQEIQYLLISFHFHWERLLGGGSWEVLPVDLGAGLSSGQDRRVIVSDHEPDVDVSIMRTVRTERESAGLPTCFAPRQCQEYPHSKLPGVI